MSKVLTVVAISGLLAASAFAQSGRWSSPILGYLYDSDARSLRPISGVPGAASLDGALAVSSKLQNARISPNRQYALANGASDDPVVLVKWSGSDATLNALEGAITPIEFSAFSPNGKAVALAGGGRVQVWSGLPDQPQLLLDVEAAGILKLAISDDAAVVVAATSDSVSILSKDGATGILNGSYSALAFAPDSHDLAAASATQDSITLVRSVDSDPQAAAIAGSGDGVAEPVDVVFSVDGRRLLVANTRQPSVLSIDLASQAKALTACDTKPVEFSRAQGNAVFRLNGMDAEQIQFYDGDSDEPRVFTVFTGVNQ